MSTITDERPTVTTAPPTPSRRATLRERISADMAVLLGAAWYVLFSIAYAVEPATDESLPVVSAAIGIATLAGLALTAAGLLLRRRWGLVASLATASLVTASSIACPMTGHHALAGWWFLQLACCAALVGASVVALRRV